MKRMKKGLSLALALLIIVSLAACSSGKNAASIGETEIMTQSYDAATPMPDMAPEEYEYVAAMPSSLSSGTAAAAISPEKLIYSGSAELETLEFDETIQKLESLIAECGGFIQNSNVSGSDYYSYSQGAVSHRSAYYEIRVPSDEFADVSGRLETLGNVTYRSTNVENITSQYQDAEARLTVLSAQEERYLELLKMAETVEEVLFIEDYLTDVRYEIERLEAQMRSWDAQVSYSTLSLQITEVTVYTEKESTPYGQQLSDAFSNSLKGLGSFFKGFFKFFVSALPVLVVLAVITVPVLLIARARSRKKKAAVKAATVKAAAEDSKEQPQ